MLAKCKEIYDHGTVSEHQELEGITQHLTNLRIAISSTQSSATTQTPDDVELGNFEDLRTVVRKENDDTRELISKAFKEQ